MCGAIALLLAIPACQHGAKGPKPTLNDGQLTAFATEDALIPALRYAYERHGLVYTHKQVQDDGVIIFELYSIRDEPATVRATPGQRDDEWRFDATIGRFGDTQRENDFLEAFGDRLRELRAVYRPELVGT